MIELTIADLLLDRPLCFAHSKVEIILSVLYRRLGIVQANGFNLTPDQFEAPQTGAFMRSMASAPAQGWSDMGNGVAVLPVTGSLVHRTRGFDALSGIQSYKQIGNDFAALMADSSVQHIVMTFDSYGGSVNGLPDLVDQVLQARGVKPITAVIDDNAYSAAYWLASAADEVIASRSSGVANIGAMAVHTDRSAANEREGIKVTAITSGSKKALLASHQPLSDDGMEYLQGEVDRIGDMFIEGSASNRRVKASMVRDLEGAPFSGPKAAELGLVDRVMSANDALREIVGRYQPNSRPPAAAQNTGRVKRAAQAMAMRQA